METRKCFVLSGPAPTTPTIGPSAEQIALLSNHENLLLSLAEIKEQMEKLEARKALVETELVAAFKRCRCESVKTEYGRFTLVENTRKQYGEDVKIAEEELKATKEQAEREGKFTLVLGKPFIKITTKK